MLSSLLNPAPTGAAKRNSTPSGAKARLVLAPNFIQLYIFWELVGLCSYLLVGHWFEKPSARDAAALKNRHD